MKINSIITIIAVATAVVAAAGCRPKTIQGGHHHDASLQLTVYNEAFEVFAEVEPLASGKHSHIHKHHHFMTHTHDGSTHTHEIVHSHSHKHYVTDSRHGHHHSREALEKKLQEQHEK